MSNRLNILVAAAIIALSPLAIPNGVSADDFQNDIFSVMTIERENSIQGQAGDNYYWLEYVYSNVAAADDDSFWRDVRSIFVEADKKIVFQLQQEVFAGNRSLVKASKVISVFDRNDDLVGSEVGYREKLISGRRFQNADSIRIRASLTEINEERATMLRQVMDQLDTIPLVTTLTQGYLTVTSTIIDAITGVTAGPSEKRKIGSYTLHGVNDLARTEYVAIVAKSDEARFVALVNNPGSIPKTPNELNAADRASLPSMVLLKVQYANSLYSPTQILSSQSPIRPLIENQINAIDKAETNYDRAKQCAQLRSALNYLGPLTTRDEGYAAMAALKAAGYDPERSVHHQNEGCLTFQEIEEARIRHQDFSWGSCISESCRVAKQFINSWALGRDSGISAETINWTAVLGDEVVDNSGDESALRSALRLRRRYGNIEPENADSYKAIGAMFGAKEGKPCVYDVEVSIGLNRINNEYKVDNVVVRETGRTFDDNKAPSEAWQLEKCSN